jgi:hypothetical protein
MVGAARGIASTMIEIASEGRLVLLTEFVAVA